MVLKWETIDLQQNATSQAAGMISILRTERAKTAGGWLVRTLVFHREITQPQGGAQDVETNVAVGLTFVPDPTNGWT